MSTGQGHRPGQTGGPGLSGPGRAAQEPVLVSTPAGLGAPLRRNL
jgi:hypothetical protein